MTRLYQSGCGRVLAFRAHIRSWGQRSTPSPGCGRHPGPTQTSLCPISESVVSVDNYRDMNKRFSNEIQVSLARSYGQDVPGGQLT